MSFVNKFKPAGNPPPGVKMEHTSFGYAQNKTPYSVPTIPKQNAPAPKTQPRGGWDDDEDDEPQLRSAGGNNRGITVQTQGQGIGKKPFIQSPATSGSNKSDDLNLGPSRRTANPAKDYELMNIDDQFLSSHEFENKTINDIIQPGGARVKQSDAVLNKFCQACESFQVPVMGTLLLSKLYEDLPFISKARTLYLIEIIVKKVKKYLEYFRHNLSTLQNADYSSEGSADQLLKITKDIVEYIQEPNKPKPQPSFPTNLTHYSNPTPVPQTTNLLGGGDDLLGSPDAKTSKPDPFGFVKKPTSETTKAQTPSSRPAATQPQQNNNQLLDLDFGSAPSQPQQSFTQPTQPISQPQSQAQPKKFNPFEIPSQGQQAKPQTVTQPQSQPQTQNTAKPSGLPGNFKKFQSSSSLQESTPTQQAHKSTTPVNQGSGLNQMDDLLSNLDFSSASTQPTSMPNTFSQPTNTFNTTPQTSGPGIKSSFPTTQPQAPTTQPSFNQPQPSTSFGNAPNQGFNAGLNANKFPQTNMPGPQMNAPYGGMGGMGGMGQGSMGPGSMGPGNMGHGQAGYGYNAIPGYGQGPTGFNAPQGNWNTGYPTGYGGFNQQGGQGHGYGYGQQQQQHQMGGFGQGQNFGGNNFQQGFNGMGGFQNQVNTQGMNSYYHQNSPDLGLYSAEAIANQEEMKKKYEKAKNEALFENLRF